jgi:tetratricopeptide (TPR) repeat protein
MAQAASPATKSAELPTIIIDPSAYEPERTDPSQPVHDHFSRLTRVTLAVTLVGGATFGIARVLELDSLLSSATVAALTASVSGQANDNAPSRSAAEDQGFAPAQLRAVLPAAAAINFAEALPTAADPIRFDEAPPAPADERVEPELPATEDVASAVAEAAPAAPNKVRPAPVVPLPKTTTKATVEDDVRNARRLLALNRFEEAETAYRNVLAVNARELAALTGIARVQLARGQLDDALASALRAVYEAPEVASAHLTLGDVLRTRGDKVAAQAHYDQATRIAASEP